MENASGGDQECWFEGCIKSSEMESGSWRDCCQSGVNPATPIYEFLKIDDANMLMKKTYKQGKKYFYLGNCDICKTCSLPKQWDKHTANDHHGKSVLLRFHES